mgnify:CR=1 FL=1
MIGLTGLAEAANLGGSDSGGSASISGAAPDSVGGDVVGINNQNNRPTDININITGGLADRDTAEAIADSLREYFGDGGRQFA